MFISQSEYGQIANIILKSYKAILCKTMPFWKKNEKEGKLRQIQLCKLYWIGIMNQWEKDRL